ncbi:MAG: TOBE domain-containing protein [Fischerella sp.]|jgi:molybdopterin-binding protein|uniref:TOBE domain-containing protein n=1 Tax=unclassified Fischerella TaxID=494603 RepID=UPI00047ACE1A|nr:MULTISPECIES: molybdopterin-binding protein [unclassified Fischerella]NWF62492.1 TOBE domain-containing protein [Fischerella sp.]
MPRKEQGWITFQASEEERKILEELSQESQRTKTEILRELVRGLSQHSSRSPQSIPTKQTHQKDADTHKAEVTTSKKPLKVSSRNVLKGVVTKVIRGEVSSQVTLKVVHEVELTSIITTASAEELEIDEGTEAYAVIKSNDIVIAKD